MSKTHYEKLAKVLKSIPVVCLSRDQRRIVSRIADVLQEDNSRFDRAKFFEACGFRPVVRRVLAGTSVPNPGRPAQLNEARTSV